jgi:uncharacterized coiled-coil protein SlyX
MATALGTIIGLQFATIGLLGAALFRLGGRNGAQPSRMDALSEAVTDRAQRVTRLEERVSRLEERILGFRSP